MNLLYPDPFKKAVDPFTILWIDTERSYIFYSEPNSDETPYAVQINVAESTSRLLWQNASTSVLQNIGFTDGSARAEASPQKLESSGDYFFIYTATDRQNGEEDPLLYYAILDENNPAEVIQAPKNSLVKLSGDQFIVSAKGLIRNPNGCPENATEEMSPEFVDNLECFIGLVEESSRPHFFDVYVGWFEISTTTTELTQNTTMTTTTTTTTTSTRTSTPQATTQLLTTSSSSQPSTSTTLESIQKKPIAFIIALVSVVIFLMVATFACCCYRRNRKRNRRVGIFMRYQDVLGIDKKTIDETVDQFKFNSKQIAINYEDKIGSGSTATVYKGFLHGNSAFAQKSLKFAHGNKFSNCNVAIKLPKELNENETGQIFRELQAMRLLGYHSHVTVLLGWCFSNDLPSLVFELAQQDLHSYISALQNSSNDESCMPLKEILSVAWQISVGMEFVASFKIIHRDLAARNVLMFPGLHVKISDFGLCCICDESFIYEATIGKRLPIRWLSLEALTEQHFSEKSDVWAFGVLLYEMYTNGAIPYSLMSNVEVIEFLQSGGRLEKPETVSTEEMYGLMMDCWKESLVDRLSFAEVTVKLWKFLEEETKNYGYLAIDHEEQEMNQVID